MRRVLAVLGVVVLAAGCVGGDGVEPAPHHQVEDDATPERDEGVTRPSVVTDAEEGSVAFEPAEERLVPASAVHGAVAEQVFDVVDVVEGVVAQEEEREVVYPDPHWPVGDPEAHGFDVDKLEEAREYSASIGGKCLLVVHEGELIYEQYANGASASTVQKGWSLSKSFTAALVGIAIKEGFIVSEGQSASDFVPSWLGTAYEGITIADLMAMTSGLRYDTLADNLWTILTEDMTEEALTFDLDAEPGEEWKYNNHGTQVLEAVLRGATGMDVEDFASEYLFGPLGFSPETYWERDRAGNPATFMGAHVTCRDLAKLGYLYLHGGRWQGEALMDPSYVASSLSASQDLNPSYGYGFWLNSGEFSFNATNKLREGQLFPFAPAELISAQGLGQSFCDIVPSGDTIYIHMRPAPHEDWGDVFGDLLGTLDKLLGDAERGIHHNLLETLQEAGPR